MPPATSVSLSTFERIWQPCLGRTLTSGRTRMLERADVLAEPSDFDLLEIDFDFEGVVRSLSWKQTKEDWELEAHDGSHLLAKQYPETEATNHPLLSKILGRRHTRLTLMADEWAEIKAAILSFGDCSIAVAIGAFTWDAETQTSVFLGFSGDDLFIWPIDEFRAKLPDHKLSVAKEVMA